jgi:hypothetical protein
MNLEALGELGRGSIALDCDDRHLHLEGRRAAATGTLHDDCEDEAIALAHALA